VFLGLLAASVLVVAGCGGSKRESRGPSAEPPATTATTRNTTTTKAEPLAGATMGPVVAPTQARDIALLERVAVGKHEGFDRVVFQFRGDLPGYRIEYVEPPLKEDGSGNPVEVQGDAFVSVRMEPASGFDLNTGEGVLVYEGPRRISGEEAGTSVAREVARTGDFEAVLTWAVGLSEKVDFRVLTLEGPPRLVVDFRNH
jgi:hypothetical protein